MGLEHKRFNDSRIRLSSWRKLHIYQHAIELKELTRMVAAMNHKIDQLLEDSMVAVVSIEVDGVIPTKHIMATVVSTEVGGVILTQPIIGFAPNTMDTQTRFFKLDFPTLEGENPMSMECKCDGFFFKYNAELESEKSMIASIQSEGKAVMKEAKLSFETPTNLEPGMQEVEQETCRQIPSLKKLSHDGMQESRNKKLCSYCDEKYELGHKCRRMHIYVLYGK